MPSRQTSATAPKRAHTRLLNLMQARPRLFVAAALGLAVWYGLPQALTSYAVTRGLLAWNAGISLYILLAGWMMWRSNQHHMRSRARRQDEGQLLIVALVFVSAIASLVAIACELSVVKDLHGLARATHTALAGYTVLASWTFIQIMFALHYAHEFYAALERGEDGGLAFPGKDGAEPDYGDFFYFAAVIGTSGQTADVSFSARRLRRVGTWHCILAYLFNTTVLALLVNIGAGLF